MKHYKNKAVLVIGHTGYIGSHLALWLQHLGAKVYGYAQKAPEVSAYRALDFRNPDYAIPGGDVFQIGDDVVEMTGNVLNMKLLYHCIDSIIQQHELTAIFYCAKLETSHDNLSGVINLFMAATHLHRSEGLDVPMVILNAFEGEFSVGDFNACFVNLGNVAGCNPREKDTQGIDIHYLSKSLLELPFKPEGKMPVQLDVSPASEQFAAMFGRYPMMYDSEKGIDWLNVYQATGSTREFELDIIRSMLENSVV